MALLPGLNIATGVVPKRKPAPKRKKAPAHTINLPAAGLQQARAGRPVAKKSKPTGGGLAAAAKRGVSGSASAKVGASAKGKVGVKKKKSGGGGLGLAAALGPDPTGLGRLGKEISGGLHDLGQVGENLGKDVINFPKQAVLGIYGIGHAAVKGIEGDPTELKALGHGLTRGAAGELLIHGDPKKALQIAHDHPLYAALDFTGAEGLLGRAGGTAARTVGTIGKEGNVLARAGRTARADLKIGDTGQVVKRSYSKDIIKKGVQVAREERLRKQGLDPHMAKQAPTLGKVGKALGITSSQESRALKRGADEEVGQTESVRRVDRGDVQDVARQLAGKSPGRKTESLRDLVQSVVEQEVSHHPAAFKGDLADKLKRLKEVDLKELQPEARRNNKAQVATIEKALAQPADKLEALRQKVVDLADQYVPHAERIEKGKIDAKALDPEQALAAKVRTYAVTKKGYRYEPSKSAPEELVLRHEAAKTAEGEAKASVDAVRTELARVETQRTRDAARIQGQRAASKDAQAVYQVKGEEFATRKAAELAHPGEKIDRVPITRAEADRVGLLAKHDRNIGELKAQRKVLSAAHRKARRERVASNPRQYVTGLVDEHGKRVSTQRILDEIAADPHARMPSFVPHITDTSGGRAHFVNFFRNRKQVDTQGVRTGSAAATGAQDSSIRSLGDSLVKGQGELSAIKAFDRYIGELGVKHPDGRLFKSSEADRVLKAQFDDDGKLRQGAVEMVKVRAVPSKYSAARSSEVEDLQGSQSYHPASSVQAHVDEALRPPGRRADGTIDPKLLKEESEQDAFALVPKTQLERFEKHQLRGSGDIGKMVQAYTGAFRGTVLPFSIKWLAGNSIEAALRLAIQDNPAGLVLSHAAGRKLLAATFKVDEETFKEFRARTTGGLQYGGQHQTYKGPERFEGTPAEEVAKRAAALRHMPIVRVIPNRVGAFQHRVFQFNAWLERNAQITALGKEARNQMQEMTGSWLKATRLQQAAVDDVAKGLVHTPNQVRFARAVDDTLGKYNRFSPNMRATVQTAAPFLPWYLNSVKFIYHTLPVKHPVKTAVVASVEQSLQGQFDKTHSDAPAGSLKSALRTKGGGFLDLSRFTPFGVLAEGGQSLSSPFFPQFEGIAQTLGGVNFTWKPLRLQSGKVVQPGSTKAITMALYSALESVVPGVSIARRLQEHGESAFDDSTVTSPKTRAGTSYGQHLPGIKGGLSAAANRVLNPARPTYLHGGPSVGDDSGEVLAPPSAAGGGFDLHSAARAGAAGPVQQTTRGGFDLHAAARAGAGHAVVATKPKFDLHAAARRRP